MRRPLRRRARALERSLAEAGERLDDALFASRAYARLRRREHVLCLGDSHVTVMEHVRLPRVWFRVHSLRGVTASGLMNPQSKTSSLEVFGAKLARARRWQHALIELGEVDCGFLIWHRAERRALAVEDQLELTLDAYARFLERVRDAGYRSVLVLSVPLPTIGEDSSRWGEVANMRKAVSATQRERTELTLRFNSELERRCRELGVSFVDVTSGHLDPGTGLVDARFLRASYDDHHLADGPFATLIAQQLLRIGLTSPDSA